MRGNDRHGSDRHGSEEHGNQRGPDHGRDPHAGTRHAHGLRGSGAVTITDVARAAGVSASTVSYVLSGKRVISPGTRERVEQSIRTLGYHPNAGARALASSRSSVLALVVPLRSDIAVPVIMQFVVTIVTAAREMNHDVLILTHDEGSAGIERVAATAMADAFLVMDVESADERIPTLRALRQPAVLLGLPDSPSGLTCVDLDFEATGALAVSHLAGHGHRRIALLGSPAAVYRRGTSYARRLLAGARTAARQDGVQLAFAACEASHPGVVQALDAVSVSGAPTALVVHNEVALGYLAEALRSRGLRVPEDVSVVAVCPPDVAEGATLDLTSLDVPAVELGTAAVRLAMARLDGDPCDPVTLLPPRLTERGSCAPPPAG